jgi:electron transfer flavoprotein beta subunit
MTGEPRHLVVAACIKWADLRPEIDPLAGSVEPQHHGEGWSASDLAAVEVALRTAAQWSGADGVDTATVVVACAGPAAAEDALRELVAVGVDRVMRVELAAQPSSAEVAAVLAEVLASEDLRVDLVVCGDASADRGSGAVPAFLAHELDASQALGLIEVTPGAAGELAALRRLDGARRERLAVQTPAVISVEGSVADLRRASLAATLAARTATVELRTPRRHPHAETLRTRPWRPRSRALPPPHGDHALDRIVQLTGAFTDRTPPRTLVLDPAEAADAVLEQLRAWGYFGPDDVDGHPDA